MGDIWKNKKYENEVVPTREDEKRSGGKLIFNRRR
jgi:hypothetical protein